MAGRPTGSGQSIGTDLRRGVRFDTGGDSYLLAERLLPLANVAVQGVAPQTAQAILRRAVGGDLSLALRIERTFSTLLPNRGVHLCSVAAISDAVGNLLARQSLVLVNLGPAVPPAASPGGVPPQAPGDRTYTEKLGKVVDGITDVPRHQVVESGRAAFDQLKREMMSSRAIAGTIVFALAAWAVAQLTGPVGWVLDGILIGIAISTLGMMAFDWFDRFAAFLLKIDRARSDKELADCSVELVNLIVEIGMATFVTLVTRAAARKLAGTSGKKSEKVAAETGRPAQTASESQAPAQKPDLTAPSNNAPTPSFKKGGLSSKEVDLAREVQDFKGGNFEGVLKRSEPGIDGYLDNSPISLKETDGGLSAVLRHASKAETQARNAGYSDVDLYIKARNITKRSLFDFADDGVLSHIPTQGTIRSIHVLTADGWVTIGN